MAGYMAHWLLVAALTASSQAPPMAQVNETAELEAFTARLDIYVEVHRRLEGPLPPLKVGKDMEEVFRLMAKLRGRIRAERRDHPQQPLVTPGMAIVLRNVVGRTLRIADLVDLDQELLEHTPTSMSPVCLNDQLPEGAPFVMIAPQLLRALPPLPPELRYIALSRALVIWDHHADMVVDVVPGLFDPKTYENKTGTNGA